MLHYKNRGLDLSNLLVPAQELNKVYTYIPVTVTMLVFSFVVCVVVCISVYVYVCIYASRCALPLSNSPSIAHTPLLLDKHPPDITSPTYSLKP